MAQTIVSRIVYSENMEQYTEEHYPWYSWDYLWSYFSYPNAKQTGLMFLVQ